MDEKGIVQTTNDVAENDDNAETQPAKGLICAFLDKYIGGIKEYVSLFTFIATVSVAVCGAVMRFCSYLYYCGYTSYWKLPREIIDVKSDNFIFEFIANAILIVFVMIINKVCFDCLKKYRKFWKLFVIGLTYLIISVSLYFVFQKHPIAILLYLLITILFLPAYSMTIADTYPAPIKSLKRKIRSTKFIKKIKEYKLVKWICKKRKRKKLKNNPIYQEESNKGKEEIVTQEGKKNKNNTTISLQKLKYITKMCAIIFFVVTPIIIIGTIWLGFQEASSEKSFRVIETCTVEDNEKKEYFAIIYETNDNYYISPCIMDNDKIVDIKKETQNTISKNEIEYTYYKY